MDTAEKLSSQMQLTTLLDGLVDLPSTLPFDSALAVTGIKLDSRELEAGNLFFACFGNNHDARDYIPQAIEAGVVAVLAEAGNGWQGVKIVQGVPVIAVDNLWCRLSALAGRYFGNPANAMQLIGITGTNGKTSCSFFLAQIYAQLGLKSGVIGTLGYGAINELKETTLTTPDAVFTQHALAEMQSQGMDVIPMEVSSVGIHQKRVRALNFDTVLFTNLSRDHLDYHENMEAYAEIKSRLFLSEGLKKAVVNLDDEYAMQMLNRIPKHVEVSSYSVKNKVAAVYTTSLTLDRKGFTASVHTPMGDGEISGKLIGYFNISNILAVITVLTADRGKESGFTLEQILSAVSALEPVSGRMEIVGDTSEITAVVDYAHTPDGLRSALSAVRDHFDGNVCCVFGCGGNRDKGKRPLMGEVAETYADKLVISDDNPRNEQGDEIVKHILSGIADKSAAKVIRDRAEAIEFAIADASAGDVVIVAGKGHETYQDVAGSKHLFSDVNQVRLALQKRR